MQLHEHEHQHQPGMFMWYHRDEIQIAMVFLLALWAFSRSLQVSLCLIILVGVTMGIVNLYRYVGVRARTGRASPSAERRMESVERFLPHYPWDRSRIVLSALTVVVLGVLWQHRWTAWLEGGTNATPTDRYWVLFLAWYWFVWVVTLLYLLAVWRMQFKRRERLHIKFFEALVGSMFFYHGLPTKSRWVTFGAAFLLGGVPSYYAVKISPDDPMGIAYANWLVAGIVLLTVGGALYTMQWLLAFETKAEHEEEAESKVGK